MATAQEFVAMAASQIGYKENPANSNNTKYGVWYPMNYEPWCDMFVSWCGNQIGAQDIVGKFAYCPYHVNWFKQKGWWLDREAQPQPGDVIFFANKGVACHVGIVERRNGSTSVTTIEGNTSVSSNDNGGAVMRRERTYGSVGSSWYILGFGRPKWEQPKPEPVILHNVRTDNFSQSDTSQLWWMRNNPPEDGKEIALRNASNRLWLSDPNSSTQEGTAAQVWGGTEDNADPRDPQIFIVRKTDHPGVFKLIPKVAPELALDVNGGDPNPHAKVQFWHEHDSRAQEFFFYKVEEGLYRIVNTAGMKVLGLY